MEATKCDVFQVVEVFIAWNSIAILEYEFKLDTPEKLELRPTPGFDLSTILIPLSLISRMQGVLWPPASPCLPWVIFITDWTMISTPFMAHATLPR